MTVATQDLGTFPVYHNPIDKDNPQPGDVAVCLTDSYYSSNGKQGMRGVLEMHSYGEGLIMLTFGARCFRPIDREDTYASISGGPCPAIERDSLIYLGTTTQLFWHWKDIPRANGGVDYLMEVGLWGWNGETYKGHMESNG